MRKLDVAMLVFLTLLVGVAVGALVQHSVTPERKVIETKTYYRTLDDPTCVSVYPAPKDCRGDKSKYSKPKHMTEYGGRA